VRRTAIARRARGAPVVASGRDTEVGSQGTGNGLRRKVRITDETASVPAYTLGVITGGPRAVGRGSISEKPKQDRSLCCAGLPSHPGEPTLSGLSMSDGTAVSPDANRAVRVPSHTDRRHNSSTLTRVAARSVARGEGAQCGMRKVRVGRMTKTPHRCRAACRDHNLRGLSPQDSHRYLPFLFHDARVELGRSAMEC